MGSSVVLEAREEQLLLERGYVSGAGMAHCLAVPLSEKRTASSSGSGLRGDMIVRGATM